MVWRAGTRLLACSALLARLKLIGIGDMQKCPTTGHPMSEETCRVKLPAVELRGQAWEGPLRAVPADMLGSRYYGRCPNPQE